MRPGTGCAYYCAHLDYSLLVNPKKGLAICRLYFFKKEGELMRREVIRNIKNLAQEAIPDHLDLWAAIQTQIEATIHKASNLENKSTKDPSLMVWESSSLWTLLKNDPADRERVNLKRISKSILLLPLALIVTLGFIISLIALERSSNIEWQLLGWIQQAQGPRATADVTTKPAEEVSIGTTAISQTHKTRGIILTTDEGPAFVNVEGDPNLTHLPFPRWAQLNWSPDGQRVVYALRRQTSGSNLFIMNADGSHVIQLSEHDIDASYPVWSPGGKQIVFTSQAGSKYQIYVVNRDGTHLTHLAPNLGDSVQAPVWSPDGQKIAFLVGQKDSDFPALNQGIDIYIVNADGTGLARLTDDRTIKTGWVTWSPDSRQIAYVSHEPEVEGTQHLYVLNIDGTGKINLTENMGLTSPFAPMWSPNGQQIVFSAGEPGAAGIYVINANGTNLTRLTGESISAFMPGWSPDGQRIAFWAGANYDKAWLYVMNVGGSNVTQLTDTPVLISPFEWLSPAADPLLLIDKFENETAESEGTPPSTAVPLAQLALQPEDLPEGAEWREAGPIRLDDPANPLFNKPGFQKEDILENYHVFARVPAPRPGREQEMIIPVINYVYRYSSPEQAKAQWASLVEFLQNLPEGTVVSPRIESTPQPFITAAKGEEGETTYWVVIVYNDILTLLIVDDGSTIFDESNPSPPKFFPEAVIRLRQRIEGRLNTPETRSTVKSLEQLVLQSEDLPEGTKWVPNGGSIFLSGFQKESILEDYSILARVPLPGMAKELASQPLINHVYRYESAEQARSQWESAVEALQNETSGEIFPDNSPTASQTSRTFTARGVGEEGEHVYWGLIVNNDVINVLVFRDFSPVAGEPNPLSQEFFMATVEKLQQKLKISRISQNGR